MGYSFRYLSPSTPFKFIYFIIEWIEIPLNSETNEMSGKGEFNWEFHFAATAMNQWILILIKEMKCANAALNGIY